MQHIDLAYAAGFFDGEGCITVTKNGSLTLSIVNTSRKVLERITATLGVGIVQDRKQKVNKRQYVYRTYGDNSSTVLRLLLPFLIEKKPQAELALDYYENHRGGVRIPGQKGVFTNPKREEVRAKLTELKLEE